MTHPLPSGWQEVKLGDIANITMGQSPKSEFYNKEKNGLPFLQGSSTFGYTYPTFNIYSSDIKKIAKNGSILMSVRAPVGDINIANTDICIGRGVCSINANNKSINNYIFYILKYYKNNLLNNQKGTTFGAITKDDIINLDVIIPPLEEQKRIAEVLSLCDEVIENLTELIEKKEQYKKGVMQRLLSGEVRFKGFKDEWQTVRLGDISEYFRGLSYKKDNVVDVGLLVLRSNNIQNYNIDFSNEELQFVNKDCSNDILLRKYDIVICMANGSKKLVGKSAEYKGNYGDKITIGAFCGLLRSQNTLLKYILQTKIYRDYIDIILAGTNINNLRSTELLDFTFLIPTSVEEQKKIASLLNAIDEDIDNLKKELELRKQQKKGLMQKLLTGAVRV